MTPLIDVVFQLLIFLLVSSQFVKPTKTVELPTGANSTAPLHQESKKAHLVTITADNILILNGVEHPLEEFPHAMASTLENSPISKLEIRGDTNSHLGTFIKVLETAKALEIESISYHKKPSPTE